MPCAFSRGDVKGAVISAGAANDNEVVAAVAGKKIRVINYVVIASGAVSVTWRSATTALTGAMPLAANAGVGGSFCETGHFWTARGEALNLFLSGATGCYGHLTYILTDD